MSLLCAGSAPPSAFMVAAILCVSNAALFHACACAAPGLSQPAAASSASTLAPLPVLRSSLRLRFIPSPILQKTLVYALAAGGLPTPVAILHCCTVQGPFDNDAADPMSQVEAAAPWLRSPCTDGCHRRGQA